MFNHLENPKEILEWLIQRNHHIPSDDLAYLLGANTLTIGSVRSKRVDR